MSGLAAADISAALGGRRHGRYFMTPCPAHHDTRASLSVRDMPGGGVSLVCFANCPRRDIVAALADMGLKVGRGNGASAGPLPPPDDEERARRAWQLWQAAIHPWFTPVRPYLESRGCAAPLEELGDEVIRFHDRFPFGEGQFRPAMLALLRDVHTLQPRGVLATALTATGLPVPDPDDPSRKLRRIHGPVGGGRTAIMLSRRRVPWLAVGEGLETMLSVAAEGIFPAWALCSARSLAALPLLPRVTAKLGIFADHDERGLAAADRCRRRWRAQGRTVEIFRPPTPGQDWNDHLGRAA